jgi:hypothetical protein
MYLFYNSILKKKTQRIKVDPNQVYKAPAIPKLSRRNIKSALITGAIKPQIALNKTKFSFVNPVTDQDLIPENLGPIVKKEGDTDKKFSIIESFLGATNKILTQVQKQLALDHLSRIAAEKAQLEKDKKRISRKKVSDKEKKIEEPGKNSILPKIFDRVTAPIKSIFQKLIDFFSIILTGLIVNNAFNWLSKKENQEKLKKFFDFVVDHWKEILILLGTAKLLGVILKIVGAAKALKGLIDLFKKKPPSNPLNCCDDKKPKGQTGRGGSSILPNKSLSRMNESYGRFIEGKSNIGDRARLLRRGMIGPRQLFTKGSFEALRGTIKSPFKINPSTGVSGLRTFGASIILDKLVELGFSEVRAKQIVDIVERYKKLPKDKKNEARNKLKQKLAQELNYQKSSMFMLDKIISLGGETQSEIKSKFGEEVLKGIGGMSVGGTVGKGDRPGTDTVPAMVRGGARIMLDADEEVINAKSSRLWRPTLKDINDNGARMWSQFVEGIKKQESTNTVQAENNTRFAKVLEDYDKVLKEEERRLRKKYNDAMLKNKPTPPGGGGGAPPAAPTPKTSGGGSSGGGGGGAPPAAPTPKTSGGGSSGGGAPSAASSSSAAPSGGASDPNGKELLKRALPGGGGGPGVYDPTKNPLKPQPQSKTSSASAETKTPSISLLPYKTNPNNLRSSLVPPNTKNPESLKPLGPSIKVFNIAETNSAIDLTNKNKVGSVPVSGGDPTPLPNISPINGLIAEAMDNWSDSLGIGMRIG